MTKNAPVTKQSDRMALRSIEGAPVVYAHASSQGIPPFLPPPAAELPPGTDDT